MAPARGADVRPTASPSHYQFVVPPPSVDVMMIAPKAPGHRMREHFVEQGIGVPCLLAVHQDATGNAKNIALAYAAGIGCARAGRTGNPRSRTKPKATCSANSRYSAAALPSPHQPGFRRRWWNGAIPPEIAYFECLHELKMIVDLIQQGGFNYMR